MNRRNTTLYNTDFIRSVIDLSDVKIKGNKLVINLSPEQLKILTCSILSNKVKLSTLKPKDEFKIGNEVFIVLKQNGDRTEVISKEFAYNHTFGGNSCWKVSNIRTLLNDVYYNKIVKLVGENNIIIMKRDLTSLDGLDDYGICYDRISLLSVSEYAKYHKILGLNSDYSDWWCLITPTSAPSNKFRHDICYVDDEGKVVSFGCNRFCGVRPFFTLTSSIMVVPNKG